MAHDRIKLPTETLCKSCDKTILIHSECVWVRTRSKGEPAAGMYHPSCYKEDIPKVEDFPPPLPVRMDLSQGIADALVALQGRTIKTVRYMTAEETKGYGWGECPVILELDDGTLLYPSTDPEGNKAGTILIQGPKEEEGCLGSLPARMADNVNRRLP